jgi:hypothetical protein
VPFDPPSSLGVQQRLIREWSDPLSRAHPSWLTDLPRRLRERAVTQAAGRRVLNALLRSRVNLPALEGFDVWLRTPWALEHADLVAAQVERAGWLLLQPWLARAIARPQVESIVAWVGRDRYEACLSAPARLCQVDRAPLPADALRSASALRAAAHDFGWQALSQVLVGPRAAVAARLRLVSGLRTPSEAAAASLALDGEALLERLAAPAEEQPA